MTPEPSLWMALADVVLALHAAYILFVVGGQVLILCGWVFAWNWTRRLGFRLLHLAAIGLVMIEAWVGVACPLTVLENALRAHAGAAVYERSFISHWLERLVFYTAPDWVFTLAYTVFAALVALTWLAYPPRRQRR